MVGHDQQPPLRRDPACVIIGDGGPQVEMVDGGIDEVQAPQVAVVGQESIGLVQSGPAPQGAQQRTGQPRAVATEPVGVAFDDLAFQRVHGQGLAAGFRRAACAWPATARCPFSGSPVTPGRLIPP